MSGGGGLVPLPLEGHLRGLGYQAGQTASVLKAYLPEGINPCGARQTGANTKITAADA
jgi:hypothetical protein